MTLHWWQHWFWITGPAPVVLMLLVALPRGLCDEAASSRRLLGLAAPDAHPDAEPSGLPVVYLTTAALPGAREPKAIGLAPPTHPSPKVTPLVPSTTAVTPTSTPSLVTSTLPSAWTDPLLSASVGPSPSAVLEIVEEVEEEVKSKNGSQSLEAEAEEVAAAELFTTPSSALGGDPSSPSSVVPAAAGNSSVAPPGDTSEEMINDEPAGIPASPSPTPAQATTTTTTAIAGGPATTLEPPSSTSSTTANYTLSPTTVPVTSRVEMPVHPAVIIKSTAAPAVTTPNANSAAITRSGNSPSTSPRPAPAPATPRHGEHDAAHHHNYSGFTGDRAAAVSPLGAVAPLRPHHAGLDAGSITGIVLGLVVFAGLAGTISFVLYRRRYLNKPQTLNDKCSNPDSSGYIDDSTLRENSEEMYSLDNDSFLNSLEAMTIQNYWTDSVKHTKL